MPKPPHTEAFAHARLTKRSFWTQKLLQPFHKKSFTQKLLHRDAFTNRSFYTEAFTQRSLETEQLLHTQKLLHREDFAQRSFFTDKGLREGTLSTNGFYIQ